MTTVTLTREFSGFSNVEDTWKIGFDDSRASTIHDYALPDGYTIGTDFCGDVAIVDPSGIYICDIVTHSSSRPQLISEAGPITAQPVLAII